MGLSHTLVLVLMTTFLPVQSASVPKDTHAASTAVIKGGEAKPLKLQGRTSPHSKQFVIIKNKLDWFSARKKCEESGMNLATIRSEEEQKALEQLMQDEGLNEEHLWLGGHDLWKAGKEGWAWRVGSTDEPFTYTHWGGGEPNDYYSNERCLYIRGNLYYIWDDFICTASFHFVCEDRVTNDERSLSKSTEVKSCQTQVSSLHDDVIQAYIIRIMKRLQTTDLHVTYSNEWQTLNFQLKRPLHKEFFIIYLKLNWFEARLFCEKSGMNLATIRSDNEQKTLEQLMKKEGIQNEDLWLGGHDLWEAGREGWSWRVGSHDEPFTYTNWVEGEPNNQSETQWCLQIRMKYNYRWDDNHCTNDRKFVCER